MIIAIWGEEGSGKSTMALSFPKPLRHFDIDIGGYARAAWRVDTTNVESKSYAIPIQIDKMIGGQGEGPSIRIPKRVVGYKETWQRIVIDFVEYCQNPDVKTIVFDSATALWKVCHQQHLQWIQEKQIAAKSNISENDLRESLMPKEYGPPNEQMRQLIYTAQSQKKNLILTHYPTDVYADKLEGERIVSYRTGELAMDGFNDTAKLVDMVVWVSMVRNPETKLYEPRGKIGKCGLEGMGVLARDREIPPTYDGIIQLQNFLKEMANGT